MDVAARVAVVVLIALCGLLGYTAARSLGDDDRSPVAPIDLDTLAPAELVPTTGPDQGGAQVVPPPTVLPAPPATVAPEPPPSAPAPPPAPVDDDDVDDVDDVDAEDAGEDDGDDD